MYLIISPIKCKLQELVKGVLKKNQLSNQLPPTESSQPARRALNLSLILKMYNFPRLMKLIECFHSKY